MELEYASHNTVVQPVSDMGDARLGCQAVRQLAGELDFTDVQREHLQIAAREITSNLVVHKAVDPILTIYKVRQGDKTGISLVASDHGPGIPSITNALADRHSSAGSMGCGLGAVRRLMDEFTIHSSVPEKPRSKHPSYFAGGTTLVASKWCHAGPPAPATFQWGGVSRPKPGYTDNGDAYFLKETETEIGLMMTDGLGHGREAALASNTAIAIFRDNPAMPLEQLLPHLHQSLRGTRGVALMAMRLHKSSRLLQYGGVGNIEAALLPKSTSTPLSRPGVVGSGMLPPLLIKTLAWPDDGMLVLHTDGISRRWSDDPNVAALRNNPLLLSHLLLRDYGRRNDDAAVLIVKEHKTHV